jgi:hypothetical protein
MRTSAQLAQQCKALYDELETTVKQLNRNLAKVSATYKDASKAKLAAAEMSAMLIQKVLDVEMPSIKLCQDLLGRGRSKCDGVVVKAHDIAKKLEKALNGVDAIAKKSDGKSKAKLEDISASISMLIFGIQEEVKRAETGKRNLDASEKIVKALAAKQPAFPGLRRQGHDPHRPRRRRDRLAGHRPERDRDRARSRRRQDLREDLIGGGGLGPPRRPAVRRCPRPRRRPRPPGAAWRAAPRRRCCCRDRAREAALRREAELLERHELRGLVDAALEHVLRLHLAELGGHQAEDDDLVLGQEAQRPEVARAARRRTRGSRRRGFISASSASATGS